MTEALRAGASQLVKVCGGVADGEHVVVLCTEVTRPLAELVVKEAEAATPHVVLLVLPESRMHGNEPSDPVAGAMASADVIFCMTPMSLAHTQARKHAAQVRARFLSLPDYSQDVLASGALQFDFLKLDDVVRQLGDIFDPAESIQIKTKTGSDVTISVAGRPTNRCPGYVREIGDLGSPPDAEINLAPVEGSAVGKLVVDGSVPCREVGLLPAPIALYFEAGRAVRVEALEPASQAAAEAVEALFESFVGTGPGDPRMLGEFGIGLNPESVLSGAMLEDEGAFGTAHFGIGSNATIGGANHIPFHLDFIFRDPTVIVDGKTLLEDGVFTGLDGVDLSMFDKAGTAA